MILLSPVLPWHPTSPRPPVKALMMCLYRAHCNWLACNRTWHRKCGLPHQARLWELPYFIIPRAQSQAPTHCGCKFLGFWVVWEQEHEAKGSSQPPQGGSEGVLAWRCGIKDIGGRHLPWERQLGVAALMTSEVLPFLGVAEMNHWWPQGLVILKF